MLARLWTVCDGEDGEHCEFNVGKVSATTTDADPIGARCSSIWSRMLLLHFLHLVYLPKGDADGGGKKKDGAQGSLVGALTVRVV